MDRNPVSPVKPVSPGSAMLESALRTGVSFVVSGIMAAGVHWLGTHGLDIKLSNDANQVASGIAWVVLLAGYSAAQRKFWPTKTDHPLAGRTDLTPEGTTSDQAGVRQDP